MSLDKFGRHSRKHNQTVTSFKPVLPHTPEGDIDVENLRICNLKPPKDGNDATTKEYVNNLLSTNLGDIENKLGVMRKGLDIIKSVGNELASVHNLVKQQQIRIDYLEKQYKILCYKDETCTSNV